MPEVLPPAGVLYDSPFSFWCWPPPRPVSSFLSSTPRVLASCLELRYSLQRGHPLSPSCVLPPLLQNFYKSEINKEEMYIRYIHKLCDMHLQAENYTGKQEGRARPPPGKGLDRHAQLTGESSELGPARCQRSVSAHDAHPLTPCPLPRLPQPSTLSSSKSCRALSVRGGEVHSTACSTGPGGGSPWARC